MCHLLLFCIRWDISVDHDGVSAGEGSLPCSGGHEWLVHLQRHTGTGRVRQPGVPEEDQLQRPGLPQTSLHQTGPTGRRQNTAPLSYSFSQLRGSFGVIKVITKI